MKRKIDLFRFIDRLEVQEKAPLPVSFHFMQSVSHIVAKRSLSHILSDQEDSEVVLLQSENQELLP
jgi:hypothetical protein